LTDNIKNILPTSRTEIQKSQGYTLDLYFALSHILLK